MILAIEHGRTVGRSDATSRHTSGTRGVTSTHVAPHAHAHAAGRARVGKERLGTVGDRGTKQVKGRQLTRPFLVRDAPYPHRVASAPSTPPPRANGQAPAPPRPTRILARPPRQLHPGETKRSEVVHNRESHVEHLGPSNPLENSRPSLHTACAEVRAEATILLQRVPKSVLRLRRTLARRHGCCSDHAVDARVDGYRRSRSPLVGEPRR